MYVLSDYIVAQRRRNGFSPGQTLIRTKVRPLKLFQGSLYIMDFKNEGQTGLACSGVTAAGSSLNMGLYVLTTTETLSDHVIETAEKHQQKAAHEGKKLKMDQTTTKKIIQYLKKLRLK